MIITVIVERKNGEVYDLDEAGIITLDFAPLAPEPETTTVEIPGVDGHLDLGTKYRGRTLRARIGISAPDIYDYALLRNEIFRIFDSKESFDLIDKKEPKKKWINCKYTSPFSLNRPSPKYGEFEIEFRSTSAYSHSRGSLLDPFTFESELWQFGMNIPLEDFSYVHNTRTFSIWNLGDKEVNPRHDMLQIFYRGASNNLRITNTTTGDTWQYFGTSQHGDTITLDGVFSRKNGVSIFGQTNRKLIRLAPGKNNFALSGAIDPFEISFDFQFLYL